MSVFKRKLHVLDAVLSSIEGIDKGAKIVQYALRLIHSLSSDVLSSTTTASIKSGFDSLSTSRKGFRLMRCTYAFPDLADFSLASDPSRLLVLSDAFNSVLGVINDSLDDVVFFGKMGFVAERIKNTADSFAERIWFTTCLIDIALLLVQLVRVQRNTKKFVLELKRNAHSLDDTVYHESNTHTVKQKVATSVESQEVSKRRRHELKQRLQALKNKRFFVLLGLLKMMGDLGIATSYVCNVTLRKHTIALLGLISGGCSFAKLCYKAAEKS